MSEYVLKLIPKNPSFVPDITVRNKIREMLSSYFNEAVQIKVRTEENIEFVDQGENFERIMCPNCDSEIDMEWWQESMGRSSEDNFRNLSITLPCCGNDSSLNDLSYEWPAGFGKFIIEIINPNIELDDKVLLNLEYTLGCGIKKIVAYY